MGSFLLKEKNGVLWRGLKGSAIFGLGFYTHDALNPYSKALMKEAKQCLAKAKSVVKEFRAGLTEIKEVEKQRDQIMQMLKTEIAKLEIDKMLEERKKADGGYTVGTCCESREESVWSFIWRK